MMARDLNVPTEIFMPSIQYPDGYRVELSACVYRHEAEQSRLLITTANHREPVTLFLRPV
jgi:hypothetical protein